MNNTTQFEGASEAFRSVMKHVMETGGEVSAVGSTKSVGAGKKCKELLHSNFLITNPLRRIVVNPHRMFNLPGAVARFLWMMSGNERLKDIEFYWGKVITPFSDDGLVVPGSNYGHRIFHSSPGLDQLHGCIERLKEDPSSRRAVIAVYQPEDTVRISKDIPCTFGISLHQREGALHAGVTMRSNNGYILFPYNFFEFSLLAELVAAELRLPLRSLHYHAFSMHVYEQDFEAARAAASPQTILSETELPAIPFDPGPLQQLNVLIHLEEDIRYAAAGLTEAKVEQWIAEAQSKLHPYWMQYFYLLLIQLCAKQKLSESAAYVHSLISEIYTPHIPSHYLGNMAKGPPPDLELSIESDRQALKLRVIPLQQHRAASLERLCRDYDADHPRSPLTFHEFTSLRSAIVEQANNDLGLAARSQSEEVSPAEFRTALDQLRKRNRT